VRPPVADSQWLQIYSPIRTPASSRLHIDDFELDGPTLGEGSFAKVKLGTHVPSNKKVAVKIIDKTKIPANIKAYAATEPGVLCRLKHANVVKMLLTHETDTEIYIFLQFMAGCDMENILISHKKVNGVRKALLIDFGFAAVVPHSDYKFTDHPGSLCYASPELLAGEKYDGTKVDVYALGVTLYTMLHGVYPFYSPDQRELTMKILNDPVECASDVTDECADLLRMMMAKNPDERPSMRAIKSHPWMKDATNPITKKTIMTPVMSRLREGLHNMSPKKGGRKLAF
jgi:serine/threonine protein kinase